MGQPWVPSCGCGTAGALSQVCGWPADYDATNIASTQTQQGSRQRTGKHTPRASCEQPASSQRRARPAAQLRGSQRDNAAPCLPIQKCNTHSTRSSIHTGSHRETYHRVCGVGTTEHLLRCGVYSSPCISRKLCAVSTNSVYFFVVHRTTTQQARDPVEEAHNATHRITACEACQMSCASF